jgi:hypothetical protein
MSKKEKKISWLESNTTLKSFLMEKCMCIYWYAIDRVCCFSLTKLPIPPETHTHNCEILISNLSKDVQLTDINIISLDCSIRRNTQYGLSSSLLYMHNMHINKIFNNNIWITIFSYTYDIWLIMFKNVVNSS